MGKKGSAAEGFERLTLLLQGVKDSSYKHAGVFFPRLAAAGETKPCHQGGSERYKKPQLPDTMSCCRAMPTLPAPCLLPLTRLGKRSLHSQCGQKILPVATSSEDLWGWWPWGHHILHGNPWPGMGRCGVGQLRQELGALGRLPGPLCTCLSSGEGTLPWSSVGMAQARAHTLDTHVVHEMGIITWCATSQELQTRETLIIYFSIAQDWVLSGIPQLKPKQLEFLHHYS